MLIHIPLQPKNLDEARKLLEAAKTPEERQRLKTWFYGAMYGSSVPFSSVIKPRNKSK